ncbi:dynamin family protein, partial [Thermosulfuriphilus sp.]
MATSYALIKEGLLETTVRLSRINPQNGGQRLEEIQQKLTEEQFNLVVMGQFKRGKSTFINALLGAEILPTAIVHLTATVTILRYGPTIKAVVHYLDGRR